MTEQAYVITDKAHQGYIRGRRWVRSRAKAERFNEHWANYYAAKFGGIVMAA